MLVNDIQIKYAWQNLLQYRATTTHSQHAKLRKQLKNTIELQ